MPVCTGAKVQIARIPASTIRSAVFCAANPGVSEVDVHTRRKVEQFVHVHRPDRIPHFTCSPWESPEAYSAAPLARLLANREFHAPCSGRLRP